MCPLVILFEIRESNVGWDLGVTSYDVCWDWNAFPWMSLCASSFTFNGDASATKRFTFYFEHGNPEILEEQSQSIGSFVGSSSLTDFQLSHFSPRKRTKEITLSGMYMHINTSRGGVHGAWSLRVFSATDNSIETIIGWLAWCVVKTASINQQANLQLLQCCIRFANDIDSSKADKMRETY